MIYLNSLIEEGAFLHPLSQVLDHLLTHPPTVHLDLF